MPASLSPTNRHTRKAPTLLGHHVHVKRAWATEPPGLGHWPPGDHVPRETCLPNGPPATSFHVKVALGHWASRTTTFHVKRATMAKS